MKKKFTAFIISFAVWCLLNWVPDWEHLLVGVGVSAFVAFLTGELFIQRLPLLFQPQRYFYFFVEYIPLFLWEAVKANGEVIYRVLHPDVLIQPGIVEVKTTLKSDMALAFLVNTLTLASGSLVVDVDPEKQILYVHCMALKDPNGKSTAEIAVGRFEKILSRIFDEGGQG